MTMFDGRRRRCSAVVCAAVAVFALAGCASGPRSVPATTASASPVPTERNGETDDTTSKAFLAQDARQEVLERYDDWVRAQPGVYRHGFIAPVDDVANTSVTLLWFGHDSWRDRLVAAGPRFGVTVQFQQRTQSLAAFTAMQRRLIDAHARFRALGFTVTTISGIGAEPQELTVSGTFAKHADRAAVQRLATSIARQPVRVETGGAIAS